MRHLAGLVCFMVFMAGCADGPDAEPVRAVDEPVLVEEREVLIDHTIWGPTYLSFSGQAAKPIVIPADRQVLSFELEMTGPADIPVSWTVTCEGCGSITVDGLLPLQIRWEEEFPAGALFASKMHRTDRTSMDDFVYTWVEGFKNARVEGSAKVVPTTLVRQNVREVIDIEGTVGCALVVENPCYGSALAPTRPFTIEAKPLGSVLGLHFNVTWDADVLGSEELLVDIDCVPFPCNEDWRGPFEIQGTSPIEIDRADLGLRPDVDVEVRVQFPGIPGLLERIQPGRQPFQVDGYAVHAVMAA